MNFDDNLSVLRCEFTNASDFQIWISYDVMQYSSFLPKPLQDLCSLQLEES